jgi:signal transduction histidine kinase
METADRGDPGAVDRDAHPDDRGRLIDALAHQLQNPLAVITGNLELLLDDLASGDPQERSLRAIERAAGRIQAMVTDLLALARVNNPDHPLHEVEVDVASLVRDVGDSVSAEAAAAELKVELELPAEPLPVIGDPGELEDLVGNLLSNAIKYSDPGGTVKVVVRSVSERATAYVELTVCDRGIGIAEEERGRLFDAFFRSRSAEARRRPGTGLGLTVVDRVVRRHHGRIEVESELGAGTSIRVLLPRPGADVG